MRSITVKLYKFDELSTDEAKNRAREWFRQGMLMEDWWESVYDDANRVGLKITSFDLDRQTITGHFLETPQDTIKKIKQEHGKKTETYQTAVLYEKQFNEKQKAVRLGKEEDSKQLAQEFLHDVLEDYRIMLTHEYQYQLSTEYVDENIRINEYEFTETGKPI